MSSLPSTSTKETTKGKAKAKPPKDCSGVTSQSIHPDWDLTTVISDNIDWQEWAVRNTVQLLDEDNTIPFIARYRKEKTNNMEADKIRHLKEQMDSLRAVQNKISSVASVIAKLGQLTPDLIQALKQAQTLTEVEHLYAPYKPGSKRTLAQRARDVGLEPLALAVTRTPHTADLRAAVKPGTEGLSNIEEVEKGVQHILSDIFSKDKEVMDNVRSSFKNAYIKLESHKSRTVDKREKEQDTNTKKNAKMTADTSKFENYFDSSFPIKYIKPHQVLAINRGESLKILTVKLNIPDQVKHNIERFAVSKFLHPRASGQVQRLVRTAVEDAYNRLIQPLMIRQIRSELTKTAEKASIEVFASNLKRLLLMPPVRGKVVLGLDPGFRTGCKLAIMSPIGTVLDTGIAYLHNNSKQEQEVRKMSQMLQKHRCETIAIGNGTACRETEQLLSKHIQRGTFKPLSVVYCIVNEAGASIYSASDEAKKEMPHLDVSERGAVSIGRRLQDPMAELVKIEPKHIGVGMYQHDLTESELRTALDGVVEDCVSFVGVDLNVCSETLLTRIAGLTKARAKKIIERRESEGAFINRQQLTKIKGLGPKSFEQCVGFVRILPETRGSASDRFPEEDNLDHEGTEASIKGGKRKAGASKTTSRPKKKAKMAASLEPNALDMTSIHPESYHIADRLIEKVGLTKEHIGQTSFTKAMTKFAMSADLARLAEEYGTFPPTMELILEGLKQPIGHDIRDEFEKPLFKQSMTSLSDLKQGAQLTGRVTNTTHFGAFVDVGVGRDGLIHVSKMPATALCGKKTLELGDKVEVTVEHVDVQRGRVNLRLQKLL